MPADALHYKFIATELDEALKGGRIDKIGAPSPETVRLHIYAGGKTRVLVMSVNASRPRCHLTTAPKESLQPPPPFAAHLKRHIGGGRIISVATEENERIIKLDIISRDELGYERGYTLIAEIMGKHSNVILVNAEGKISEALKHISLDMSSKRQVLPGLLYEPAPSQGKANPANSDALQAVLAAYSGGDLAGYLLKTVSGLSPVSIAEIVYSVNGKDVVNGGWWMAEGKDMVEDNKDKNMSAFPHASIIANCEPAQIQTPAIHHAPCTIHRPPIVSQLIYEIQRLFDPYTFAPCVRLDENGGVADFYLKPYRSCEGVYERAESLNEAADRYYSFVEAGAAREEKRNKLTAAVKASVARAEKKLALLVDQKVAAGDFEEERIRGEILTANLYRIKPGDKVLAAENYYLEPPAPIEIQLDGTLPPAKLAQRFYKRYQKKKKTLEAVEPLFESVQSLLEYLESVSVSLKTAETLSDLDEIADELVNGGIVKETKNKKQKIKNDSGNRLSGVKKTEFEGYLILTGKNNLQNDALAKSSAPHDLWLHTKNIHGAHTVIVNPKKTLPPESVIRRAAAITALYSKAGASENVPVDYTFIKFVSKPKSAAPGKVVYTNQKTVYVRPMNKSSPNKPGDDAQYRQQQ